MAEHSPADLGCNFRSRQVKGVFLYILENKSSDSDADIGEQKRSEQVHVTAE